MNSPRSSGVSPAPISMSMAAGPRLVLALLLSLSVLPLLRAQSDSVAVPVPGPVKGPALSSDATPNEILAQAKLLTKRNDFDTAQQLLDKLIARPGVDRPVVAEAVFLKAQLLQQTDQMTNAVIWYERYITNYPDQTEAPYANFLLGQCYKQLGNYGRARESFYNTMSFAIKQASTLQSDDFSSAVRLSQAAAWELAETEYLANNWERADELYARYVKQNPSMERLCETAAYRQADISFQLNRPKEAISRYETALAMAPFHPFAAEAWLRLVSLYGLNGDQERQNQALQSFIWVVDTLEKDDQLYWQRRCADQLLSQYKDHLADQIPLLETILKNQNSQNAESWMRMLDFYLALLDRQTAQPANPDIPQPSSASGDTWNQWLGGFRDRLGKIVQKIATVQGGDGAMKDAATPQ